MKNKGIVLFLIILAIVIVAVMVGDWYSKRPDKMEPNKFEFSVEEFKLVPEELIHYRETKNFKIGFETPRGITVADENIYLVGDRKLQVISLEGKLVNEIELNGEPKTVEVSYGKIVVAFKNAVQVFNSAGELQAEWTLDGENSFLTAVALQEETIIIADAGTRKIYRYTMKGEKINEFEGKASDDVLHGFIIPSPYFDLDMNADGDLWVVNPGIHALENYTPDGNLREHWNNTSIQIEGFSGCCNPAHFTFLSDGSFVTSEKGMVRIKIYKPSGEFSGVVAAPEKFKDEGEAPDVAVDNNGNVYALDFDKKIIRVFEPKNI